MTDAERVQLRAWQVEAFARWRESGRRGIVSVVTGGGKTILALECLREFRLTVPAATVVVVVPTVALLDQWVAEVSSFLEWPIDQVRVLSGRSRISASSVSIGVLNTVSQLAERPFGAPLFLIVDECHRAAAAQLSQVFRLPTKATLGLSATPERPYDSGLDSILIPMLGPIIYEYDYRMALRDGVIVPFKLVNILVTFEDEVRDEYDRLTRAIRVTIDKEGPDSPKAVALMLRRARVSNRSLSRVRAALQVVARHRSRRILVFHEDIECCRAIAGVLAANGVPCLQYHSGIPVSDRVRSLMDFRQGRGTVLVTCRALDEGVNVPEADVGVIVASTASQRQRIQRMGRLLRPSPGKGHATIYSVVGTSGEMAKLAEEAKKLDDLVEVQWTQA